MWTLGRASLVSLAATGLELAVLPLLVHLAGVAPAIAYATVQLGANAITFLFYKYWAFGAARRGALPTQYAKQLVVFGGSWVLNTALPSLLSYRMGFEPTLAFAISNVVVYLAWNYPGNKYWVFR